MKYIIPTISLLLLLTHSFADAQSQTPGTFRVFNKNVSVEKNINLGYSVYIPPSYDILEKWPLIVYLHGAGVRGNDVLIPQTRGIGKVINEGQHMPFVVVIPQCPVDVSWEDIEIAKAVKNCIAKVQEDYRIDNDRIYLTGNSLGGIGTWMIGAAYPELFAAIAPLSGYGNIKVAERLKDIPIWAFHGGKDEVIDVKKGQAMADAVKVFNPFIRFTVYPESGHRPWKIIYRDPKFYSWLSDQRK